MTRRQATGLFVLCLAVFMVAVDGTVVSVAVPSITEQLRPNYNQVLWIGDIYSCWPVCSSPWAMSATGSVANG